MVLHTLIWSSIRVTLLTLKISNWWKTQNLAELLEEKWSPLGIFIKTVFHGISLCRRQWSSWDRTSVGDHSFQSTRRYFENGQEMLPLVLWFKCLLIPSKWNWRCWSLSSVWLFVAPWTVHGILQTRILELVAIPFPRGLPYPGIKPRSPPWQILCHVSQTLELTILS